MFNGYPVCPALTSLALLASLAMTPPPTPKAQACSDIGRLYSPRLLRELRARLILAYEESHEHRAAEIAAAIRRRRPIAAALDPGFARSAQIHIDPQESDDPKLRHLLVYVAKNCL